MSTYVILKPAIYSYLRIIFVDSMSCKSCTDCGGNLIIIVTSHPVETGV